MKPRRRDLRGLVEVLAFVKGHEQSDSLPKEAFSKSHVWEMREVVQDSSSFDLDAESHGGPFKSHQLLHSASGVANVTRAIMLTFP